MVRISSTRKLIWALMGLLIVATFVLRGYMMEDPEFNEVQLNASGRGVRWLLPAGDVPEREGDISVTVSGLGIHPETGATAVFLVTEEGDAYLPIFIGQFEASAISRSLQGIRTPRPMTHDLLSDMIDIFGGKMEKVVVSSLENGTFKAILVIETSDGQTGYLDARPSDSIALALLKGADIYVAAPVMENAGYRIQEDDDIPGEPGVPGAQFPEGELI